MALEYTYVVGVEEKFETLCPIVETETATDEYRILVEGAGTLRQDEEVGSACHWDIGSPLTENYFVEGESEMVLVLQ